MLFIESPCIFWTIMANRGSGCIAAGDPIRILLQSSYDVIRILLGSSYDPITILLRSYCDIITILLRPPDDPIKILLRSHQDPITIKQTLQQKLWNVLGKSKCSKQHMVHFEHSKNIKSIVVNCEVPKNVQNNYGIIWKFER